MDIAPLTDIFLLQIHRSTRQVCASSSRHFHLDGDTCAECLRPAVTGICLTRLLHVQVYTTSRQFDGHFGMSQLEIRTGVVTIIIFMSFIFGQKVLQQKMRYLGIAEKPGGQISHFFTDSQLLSTPNRLFKCPPAKFLKINIFFYSLTKHFSPLIFLQDYKNSLRRLSEVRRLIIEKNKRNIFLELNQSDLMKRLLCFFDEKLRHDSGISRCGDEDEKDT